MSKADKEISSIRDKLLHKKQTFVSPPVVNMANMASPSKS